RNRYVSAWKQLAATLGLPGLPPTELHGSADMSITAFDYQAVLEHVLAGHTIIQAAGNAVQKAQIDLRLAQVTPVPDVNGNLAVQRDDTTTPRDYTYCVQVGVPIPVFDRNQGAIQAAEARLIRAEHEAARVRSELTAAVAEAYERYDTNGRIVQFYRDSILP